MISGIVSNDSLLEEFIKNFDKYIPIMLEYNDKSKEVKQRITNKLRTFYFGNGLINNKSTEKLGQVSFFI